MFSSNPRDADLLKSILEPLLDDFQHWFGRSRLLLETEEIPFLSVDQQADYLARIITAQQEVSTAQMMFQATNGQAAIDPAVLSPWHRLVAECWQIAVRYRLEQSELEQSN